MKKYYFLEGSFKNRVVISIIAIILLFVFNVWFSYKDKVPLKSAINQNDKLSVVEIKRLTHPDYAATNTFYGTVNPLNSDESRALIYELESTTDGPGGGRAYVWGYIGEDECAQHLPCLLNWQTKTEYEQAAQPIPKIDTTTPHRWKADNLYWSPLASEPDVLYGMAATGLYNIYRINLTDNLVTPIAAFDNPNGNVIDVSGTTCYGFTSRNTLWCSFTTSGWSLGGFELDITNNQIDFFSSADFRADNNPAITYCRANPNTSLPAYYYGFPTSGSGHGAYSNSGAYKSVYYGDEWGVWRLRDCKYLYDNTHDVNYPHDLYWLEIRPDHIAWNNVQDNYFFGDIANGFYIQREGHNTEPWLKPVSLTQILFDEESGAFEFNHLTTFLTAGKWNTDAPVTCSAAYPRCVYQWQASPLPWVDSTGRKLLFTSTMGEYSFTDWNKDLLYHVKEPPLARPAAANGLFMATLALNSEINECIDNDKDGFGARCVFGSDCNDNNHYINPNMPEIYDGVDNNCNGQIDCADDPNLICSPKNLYVDVASLGGSCSDSRTRAANSIGNPFCSITKANEVVEPGDTILIRQGTYYEHGLVLDRGGTTMNHRVIFRPYQNEVVNINLGEKFNSWTDLGSNIYRKSFLSSGFDIVSLKAIAENSYAILETNSLANLQNANYASGQNLFYVDDNNSNVYLRLSSLNPNNVFFVDTESKVTVQSPFITWQNLNLAYAYKGFDVVSYGIFDYATEHGRYFYLNNSTVKHTYYEGFSSDQQSIQVANNFFDYNGVPVLWDGDSVEKNIDAIGIFAFGSNALIENNTIKHVETGINYRHSSTLPGYTVKDFVIRNNDIYGRVVGSGFNNLFYNNIIQYPASVGFSLYYANNSNKVYNNLIYSAYGVLLSRYGTGENVDFRNNIVFGAINARCMDFDAGNLNSFTLDYNLYYNCSQTLRNNTTFSSNFNSYKTLMAAFGEEQHSINLNPSLAAADAAIPFYPSSTSSILDVGTSLSNIFSFDKRSIVRPYNNLWDIGPYEFSLAAVGPTCGNFIIEAGEQCDDGNLINGDGCSSTCQIEQVNPPPASCTDNIQNGNETGIDCGGSCPACDNSGGGGTPPPPPEDPPIACGNSIQESGETCDDGNLVNNDGCSYLCQIETDVTPTSTPNILEINKLQGRIVKTNNDPKVYYINLNNERFFIPNLNTFKSWFRNFNSLEIVSPQTLAAYEYLGRLTVKPGNLVKFANDNKVYAVEPTKTLRWIKTGTVFKDFGYDFKKVINLPSEDLQYYTQGEDLESSTTHPTGQLLKHGNYPPIFYIKDNIEYWIKDETTFLSLGFKWQDVITIPVRYWYTRVLDNLNFRLKER